MHSTHSALTLDCPNYNVIYSILNSVFCVRSGFVPAALEEKDLIVSEIANRVRIAVSHTSALLKSTRVPVFYDIEYRFNNQRSWTVCADEFLLVK